MKKILFCSRTGIESDTSTGGQILRIETSIKSINKVAKIDIVSRNLRLKKNNKINYLQKYNVFLAPSVKKLLSKNNLIFKFQWRIREIFYLKKDAKFIANLAKKNNYDCVWISYASQSYFLIREIKKIDKKIKIIADTDSVFFKFIERKIKYANFFNKIVIYLYSLIYQEIEKKMIKISDITTAVSDYDKKLFEKFNLNKKIFIFRNSVERKNFKIKKKNHSSFNIIISGTFGSKISPMNISANWFLKKIYPLIENKLNNFKIYIVGINSKKFIKNYNINNKKIIATGWVKNIKKYFSIADLSLVPLLYESGTRFKILEAALYKIPVISTTLGAEGLPLKNNKSIFIENDPKRFARKIINISRNKKLMNKIANDSNKIVLKSFSEVSQSKDAIKILKKL